jgi:hypothetical protein
MTKTDKETTVYLSNLTDDEFDRAVDIVHRMEEQRGQKNSDDKGHNISR